MEFPPFVSAQIYLTLCHTTQTSRLHQRLVMGTFCLQHLVIGKSANWLILVVRHSAGISTITIVIFSIINFIVVVLIYLCAGSAAMAALKLPVPLRWIMEAMFYFGKTCFQYFLLKQVYVLYHHWKAEDNHNVLQNGEKKFVEKS